MNSKTFYGLFPFFRCIIHRGGSLDWCQPFGNPCRCDTPFALESLRPDGMEMPILELSISCPSNFLGIFSQVILLVSDQDLFPLVPVCLWMQVVFVS